MFKRRNLSASIKKQTEEVICRKCNASTLSFKSADYGYIKEENGMIAYMRCKKCENEPAIIVRGINPH